MDDTCTTFGHLLTEIYRRKKKHKRPETLGGMKMRYTKCKTQNIVNNVNKIVDLVPINSFLGVYSLPERFYQSQRHKIFWK